MIALADLAGREETAPAAGVRAIAQRLAHAHLIRR